MKNPIRWALFGLGSMPAFVIGMKLVGVPMADSIKYFVFFAFISLSSMEGIIKSKGIKGDKKGTIYAIAIVMLVLGAIFLAII